MDDLKSIIGKVATGATLTREEAASAFDSMMSGEATPSQMGGLLMALRVRGETVEEITGAVTAMRGFHCLACSTRRAMLAPPVSASRSGPPSTLNSRLRVTALSVARAMPLWVIGSSQCGRSAMEASRSTPSGCTTSIRAESRGLAGRSAMLSGGSSKSKRSVRMARLLLQRCRHGIARGVIP